MPPGGARNRSGPQRDENSGRSERRGVVVTALPSEGWDGEAPPFPLFRPTKRERELWAWAWKTPQAAAWAKEPWRWHTVAMWVRTAIVCEGRAARAADKNSLHRFADQIGLTPAGMRENGWAIATDQLAEKRAEKAAPEEDDDDPRDRFTVVTDGAGT